MRIVVEHRTQYSFSQPQRRLIQLLRVTPPSFEGQSVIDWHVEVDCDAKLKRRRDGYGNEFTMVYVDGPISRISLTVGGEVLTEDKSGVVRGVAEPLPPELFLRSTPQSFADEAISSFAQSVAEHETDGIARLHALNSQLNTRIGFDTGHSDPHRTAAEAFEDGHGVCQDHAHIFCAAARTMGYPARYVSGHLWRPDEQNVQAAAHAWAEAYVDGLGWVGFDAANGICPNEAYVRVAAGLDYRDAAPVAGARIGGGEESLEVQVAVAQAGAQRQS